jgi:hypothetical protein
MIIKTKVLKQIDNYCKEHNIKKADYNLNPLYIHLNGFSHSIGFTKHKTKKGTIATNYTSVGYSAYTGGNTWGAQNVHQQNIALMILRVEPHYLYQNNAKEILF